MYSGARGATCYMLGVEKVYGRFDTKSFRYKSLRYKRRFDEEHGNALRVTPDGGQLGHLQPELVDPL